jgi:L-lactate dehydrogenase (cytochrome)
MASARGAKHPMKAASVLDYRELARRRLPKFLFEYIDGGSYDELTLQRNVADLRAIAVRQRVLRNVASIDLSCELLGRRIALPGCWGRSAGWHECAKR